MGVDFINKVGRTYDKHLDVARARLGTADLFTRAPVEDCPTFPIDLVRGARVSAKAELTAEIEGGALVLRRGLDVVARHETPPADVVQAVGASCGIATAIVQDVHELSGVAEVILC